MHGWVHGWCMAWCMGGGGGDVGVGFRSVFEVVFCFTRLIEV